MHHEVCVSACVTLRHGQQLDNNMPDRDGKHSGSVPTVTCQSRGWSNVKQKQLQAFGH